MKTFFNTAITLSFLLLITGKFFAQGGQLDLGFGSAGYVVTDDYGWFSAMTVQSDGKILAVGKYGADAARIIRYNADGSPDTSFGAGGTAELGYNYCGNFNGAVTVTVDGKILAAVPDNPNCQSLAGTVHLVKLKAGGGLDNAFGANGSLDLSGFGPIEVYSPDIHALPDGKFIFIGAPGDWQTTSEVKIFVARFNSDGSADATFGTNGVTTLLANQFQIKRLRSIIQPDGRLLIAATGSEPSQRLTLFRLGETGVPDVTFGSNGKSVHNMPFMSEVGGLVLFPDGNIAVGLATSYDALSDHYFYLTRHLSDGTLENLISINLGERCSAAGLALQPDGKVVLGGMAGVGNGEDFILTRFLPDGTMDLGFGENGIVKKLNPSINHCATIMKIQTDGKLLLSGFSLPGYYGSLVRYESGVSVDTGTTPSPFFEATVTPNPVSNFALLRFTLAENTPVAITVYDASGKLILTEKKNRQAGKQQKQIDVQDLLPGMYFVSVITNAGTAVRKFVKK